VQAYALWYLVLESPDEQEWAEAEPADASTARAIQEQIDQLLPGLRTAPRPEKKHFGRQLLHGAVAGWLVEHGGASLTSIWSPSAAQQINKNVDKGGDATQK
jgi:hypothetical protein